MCRTTYLQRLQNKKYTNITLKNKADFHKKSVELILILKGEDMEYVAKKEEASQQGRNP